MPIIVPIKGEKFELSIDVGEKIELYIQRGVGNKRYASMIQDYDDQHFLVNAPTIQGQEIPLPEGEEIIVRIARYDSAYSYNAHVFGRRTVRGSLTFIAISQPKILTRTQLRWFSRIPITFKVTLDAIEDSDDMEEYLGLEGTALDFSAGGLKFRVPKEIPRGSFLFLKLLHPDLNNLGIILAKSVLCQPDKGTDYIVKSQFVGLSREVVTDMIRFIWAHEIELRRMGVI